MQEESRDENRTTRPPVRRCPGEFLHLTGATFSVRALDLVRAPVLPKFQRQISENRIGGSNDHLPPTSHLFLEIARFLVRKCENPANSRYFGLGTEAGDSSIL